MSNESPVLKNLTESSAQVPRAPGTQDSYVLLLVLLCVFVGGILALLSLLLIFCRRCCHGARRYSRASNDPEKTNTTYLEESQPPPEITIQVDESDQLSTSSGHDVETERFLSTSSTGRRVSFNESALLDHGKRTQEKGRRYTLTEGDFHHLKNARLTHLHLPPPALKIVTIHECESSENGIDMTMRPAPKPCLSIFQPPVCPLPQTALTGLGLSPSSALPGDTLNSVVDTGFSESPPAPTSAPPRSCTIAVMGVGTWNGSSPGLDGDRVSEEGVTAVAGQGTVLQFFTKLRRHASLEGASPYFKIKSWKLDSSQRASSLDTRGSPKRHQFQRQRAASESTQQAEEDSHPMDLVLSVTCTHDEAFHPSHPSPGLPSPPPTPPPSLSRLEVEDRGAEATGLLPQESQEEEQEVWSGAGAGASFRQDSSEHHTLYRDIWTLRASLEQYASSDQSSNNDKDSTRSDADSVCSFGGGAMRRRLSSCPSQDIGDEPEGGAELPGKQGDSFDSERGSDGEAGNRKLLQMDSGYASIEAPPRAPEDLRLFGSGSGGAKGKTASEKRRFFTSAGRTGTVCESFEEEPEEQAAAAAGAEAPSPAGWSPYGQAFSPKEAKPRPRLRRRDYSIDEKTDALFNEFLRHDPQLEKQESPLRPRHRSRVHLRKQWQRAKQKSDPGVHFPHALERQRTPLRRGDSANFPLDTRYHSTLPRIVSAADEEASEAAATAADTARAEPSGDGAAAADTPRVEPSEGGATAADTPRVEASEGGATAADTPRMEASEGGATAADTPRMEASEGGATAADTPRAEPGEGGTIVVDTPQVASSEGGASAGLSEGGVSKADTPETSALETEEDKTKVSPSSSSSSSSSSCSSNRTIKEGDTSSPPPLWEQPEPPEDNREAGHPPDPPDDTSAPLPPETGYGPQTITAELADKLADGLEERLYTSLRRAKDSPECVVAVVEASPDHSPV
ncbi:voltage-dependent calcium channel beta subunit-associated regulatory protein-like [Megalops cyprinoides]|uniref:voltage-dependent calcium channel beta subunit-associated regulatory protein-like n=1 Tax=Megalops cyprinoides TaxID=118141 RepID=UPI0018644AD6|nr:voltage-dependent calcium channel beta subunit-associated regulatory protein-like [Megalops cyprinoides]